MKEQRKESRSRRKFSRKQAKKLVSFYREQSQCVNKLPKKQVISNAQLFTDITAFRKLTENEESLNDEPSRLRALAMFVPEAMHAAKTLNEFTEYQ